ncbi:MAG: hypothetical protein HN392_10505 [Anaerolineae bacterium]|jgi:hypothetical protein|nr:hypothetical protein [Anaerolineae bacterium]MBT7075806.1 hypothetical protein [Anaerolineae bacterium]MBT7783244.1 hypothetical protein [Anaerolineae bacterium]
MPTIKKDFPFYTILFALYPSLSLLALNIGEIDFNVAYRTIFFSITLASVLLFILVFVLKNWAKGGLILFLALIIFFYYGHLYNFTKNLNILGIPIGRHRFLFLLILVIFTLFLWMILQKTTYEPSYTSNMNIIILFLLFWPTFQLARFAYTQWETGQKEILQSLELPDNIPVDRPDIYFIILDTYGRSDVLQEEFDYDDSFFLEELENLGFFIDRCSRSNYVSTYSSLAATLNINYLQVLGEDTFPEDESLPLLHRFITENLVSDTLKKFGYQTIAFETGYEWAELDTADRFYTLRSSKINNFESLFIRNSLLLLLDDLGYFSTLKLTDDEWKKDSILFTVETLRKLPKKPGPKFIVAHLILPHPLFVLDENGEFSVVSPRYEDGEYGYTKEDYKKGIQNQVGFINNVFPDILNDIIKNSEVEPIIIIQGDHGFRKIPIEDQLKNFSAYYIPQARQSLHSNLTPVNNFRFIFNSYFGFELPELENESYLSGETFFDFIEVEENCGFLEKK